MRNMVIMPVRGKQGGGSGGSTVPVIPAPSGEFYAAISYFTGRVGDYDNYAYGYVKTSAEFTAEFCHSSTFANFNLYTTADGGEQLVIPASSILGFYFGARFNQTNIDDCFLGHCYSFNQPLTIPSGVTYIGIYFLSYCYSFNQSLTIPDSVTYIDGYFMRECRSFNQPLTIPNSVTNIRGYFMRECYSFNQPLTIPYSVRYIGDNFLYCCYSFRKLIAECAEPPTDIGSLSTIATAESYVNGITITGTYAAQWKAALPDRTSNPFRKLIVQRSILDWRVGEDVGGQTIDLKGNGLPFLKKEGTDEEWIITISFNNLDNVRWGSLGIVQYNFTNAPVSEYPYGIFEEGGYIFPALLVYNGNALGDLIGMPDAPDGWQPVTSFTIPEGYTVREIVIGTKMRERIEGEWYMGDIPVR